MATFPAAINQRFVYDENSQLLSEYGTNTRDYIWLDSMPVATVDTSGTTSTVSYVTADGLNTPREVVDANGNTIWQWSYQGNPFGEQQPTSTTGYVLNLRFPGQYYDVESGLAYNVNRYYEAARGGYGQADPLGPGGGSNPYAYVDNDPLTYIDPLGLARTTIDAAIQQALMRGDVAELETILDAAASNEERAAARAAIDRLNSRVGDIISKECRGSINREFPGQYRDKTLQELMQDKNAGDAAARKAWKLINDSRFQK